MQATEALTRLGGTASAAQLVALSSRRKLRTALRLGEIHRRSRDRYVLAAASRGRAAAAELHGLVSHLDAALHWGWEIKAQPERPHVTVPRNRKVSRERQALVHLHWRACSPAEASADVTSALRTVVDCARDLAFDEALAVADSALRHGSVTHEELVEATARLRGPGSARARRVVSHADRRAANPFESVLRALAIEEGLGVVPQHAVEVADGRVLHPDLADPVLGLALEADSWTHHAGRDAHARDCTRYNLLVLAGWTVLRFTWEQVMLSPGYVQWILAQAQAPTAARTCTSTATRRTRRVTA